MPPNLHNFCAFFQCFSVFCSVLVQHSLTWEMETRLGSSSSSSGIVIYIWMKLLKHYVTHCLYSFHISHFMCACSSITFCLCLHQNFIDVSPFFSFVQQIEPTKTNWVSKSCIWGPKLDLMGPFGPWIGTWRGQNQVLGVSHDRLNWYQSIFHFCTATWVHPGSVCPKKLSFKEKVTFFRITPPSTPISKTQFD